MINRLELHIAKLEGEAEKEALESLWVCDLCGVLFWFFFGCMHAYLSGCTLEADVCLWLSLHACPRSHVCILRISSFTTMICLFFRNPLMYRQKQVFVFGPCAGGIPSMSVWLHLLDSYLLLSIARNQGHPGCPPCC